MLMSEAFDTVLRQALRGEEPAWSNLFQRYAPAVLGFLRSIGADEPEDLLSETFLQAARDLHAFHGNEQQFRSWIFTIARHRVIDAARQSARRPAVNQAGMSALDHADSATPSTAGVDDTVIANEEVFRLLERLNPVEREIVALRFVADLDVKTVAAIVGKRPNTVTVMTRRALAKLHTAFT